LRNALAAAAWPATKPDGTPVADARPIAVGWATVELDRAARELAADLGIEPGAFIAAPDSGVRVARTTLPGEVAVAVLEPNTEGRLAAILARHGEGPAAIWLEAGETRQAEDARRPPDTRDGPFGPERPLDGERPVRFLVERPAGTIAS
jgi:hypothetical protein